MNILLTSVGRRGYLVKYFKEALAGDGKVHVANSSSISPAFVYADRYVVTPLIYEEEYISFIKNYCIENGIEVIVSLFDVDLLVLSKHKTELGDMGINVIVSDASVIEICNDKWKTFNFLSEKGFNVPTTFLSIEKFEGALSSHDINFPVILKPRWGMGSISVYCADNMEEVRIFYDKIEKQIRSSYLKYESDKTEGENVIIQEKLNGQEFGLDVINNLEGKYQNTVVKMKYSMRAGETDCALTVDNSVLRECGKDISNAMGHVGNLDVDVFYYQDQPYILEMNARFGGGYPFSHAAGVDLPKAIIQWVKGDVVDESLLIYESNILAHKDINICKLEN